MKTSAQTHGPAAATAAAAAAAQPWPPPESELQLHSSQLRAAAIPSACTMRVCTVETPLRVGLQPARATTSALVECAMAMLLPGAGGAGGEIDSVVLQRRRRRRCDRTCPGTRNSPSVHSPPPRTIAATIHRPASAASGPSGPRKHHPGSFRSRAACVVKDANTGRQSDVR